jgi:adenosylcobinamide-GDP ribazoletransferase
VSTIVWLRRTWQDLLRAVQFCTRIPVPAVPYDPTALPRSLKFFPVVGLGIGAAAALVQAIFSPHLARPLAALLVLSFLVLITGCLHEDALADAADGFGGGWTREKVLLIMRDSRIGSYGATALVLSLSARLLLLSAIPSWHIARYLIVAQVLCRWTTLPLSFALPSARAIEGAPTDGLGTVIARLTTPATLIGGTLVSVLIAFICLGRASIAPIAAACMVTLLSGLYYRRRIGGVTGDCFGATNQLTEIAIYLCGAWTA